MSDTIAITAGQQRQLDVIERRLAQVEPVLSAIHKATELLPAADRLAVLQRLERLARAQRGTWNVSQPQTQQSNDSAPLHAIMER